MTEESERKDEATRPMPPPSTPPPKGGREPGEGTPQTPADRLLSEEGGPIVPDLSGGRKLLDYNDLKPVIEKSPLPETPEGAARQVLRAMGGQLGEDGSLPESLRSQTNLSPETAKFMEDLNAQIDYELNIMNSCYEATTNFVSHRMRQSPTDVADFNQFGADKRSPIEEAEPYIAIEVYKNVRRNMRGDERPAGFLDLLEKAVRFLRAMR